MVRHSDHRDSLTKRVAVFDVIVPSFCLVFVDSYQWIADAGGIC